ncbi:hypothetical protein ACWKX9_24480 [Enterobacter asburiae]
MKKIINGMCLYMALVTGAMAVGNNNVQLSDLHFQTAQNGLQMVQGLGQNTSSETLQNIIICISRDLI